MKCPPIGTECEFRYKYSDKGHFADWIRGTIKYIGNNLFVAEVKGKEQGYNDLDVCEFRPVINKIEKFEEVDESWYTRGEKPPVGCDCLIHHVAWYKDKYEKVRIVAITEEYLIVKYENMEQMK